MNDALTLILEAIAAGRLDVWRTECAGKPYAQFRRILGNGKQATLMPLTFGRARICVGKEGDTSGYSDGY